MGWTRQAGRVARARRRPCLESLETRQLLSLASVSPNPMSSAVVNSNGSTNYDQIIGASAARSAYNVDGSGQTVAMIDTGVDYNNPAFGGGIGPTNKVVTGVDYTGSPNGVVPTWQHGTGTAGIAAGNGGGYTGVAPGADIVALRVFGDNNQGSFDQIVEALDWVVLNHSQYNISVVNLSVSDGGNYASNIFSDSGVGQEITDAIGRLDALNIPVVIAAGNSFDGQAQGLGFPAIVPDAISVTSTDSTDQLASDAQRLGSALGGNSAVKLAAPGVNITAPSGDKGTTTETGSSFSAPQVSGSILLLQQMYEQAYHTLPTVAQIDQLLQQGAVNVHDKTTGINVGRLDILNSATLLEQQIQAQTKTTTTSTPASPSTPSAPSPPPTTTSNSSSTTTSPTTTGTPPATVNPPATATPPTTASGSTSSTTSSTSTSSGTTSTPKSNSGTSTSSSSTTTALTQVFVNGVSLGDYSTNQLAAKYPGLFAFLNGPVPSINIWAPAGSTVDLGPAASATAPAPASVGHAPLVKHPNLIKMGIEQEAAIKASKTVAAAHKAAAPKKPHTISSFFSSLFHF